MKNYGIYSLEENLEEHIISMEFVTHAHIKIMMTINIEHLLKARQ